MPAITIPGTSIKYGWQEREKGWGPGMNTNLLVLGVIAKGQVLSQTTTAPPSDPDEGDAYIIPAGATGAWSGRENEIAAFFSDAWAYIEPVGAPMYVIDEAARVYYDGSEWSASELPQYDFVNQSTAAGDFASLADGDKLLGVDVSDSDTAKNLTLSQLAASQAMATSHVKRVVDLTALRALTGMQANQTVEMVTTGRAGLFRWDSSDLSAEVAADPQMGMFVPSNADPTGASGAWVRVQTKPNSVASMFDAGRNGGLIDFGVAARLMYVRRVGSETIAVGTVQANGRAIEYWLESDVDGYVGVKRGYAGEAAYFSYIKPTLTGTFTTANQNSYTTTVGDTLSFSFTGTGFTFVHYADDRGGVWSFEVDGVAVGDVSTYAATPASAVETEIVSGLADAEHNVVATFTGDDPANPPSSGAGTARGWLHYDFNDLGTESRTTIKAEGAQLRALDDSIGVEVIPDSVFEIAMSCAPAGSGYSSKWFPDHGDAGSVRDRTATLTIDGVSFDDDITLFIGRENFEQALIYRQVFTAYHPDDASGTYPMAEVTIEHRFTPDGLTVSRWVEWLLDVTVTGYLGMLPVNGTNLPQILTNAGHKDTLTSPASQTSTDFLVVPDGVMCVNTDTGHGVAISAAAPDVTDSRNWTPPAAPAFYTERPTGIAKAYWYAADSRQLVSGDRMFASTRYTIVAGADFPDSFDA